jgi:hypothetical protein
MSFKTQYLAGGDGNLPFRNMDCQYDVSVTNPQDILKASVKATRKNEDGSFSIIVWVNGCDVVNGRHIPIGIDFREIDPPDTPGISVETGDSLSEKNPQQSYFELDFSADSYLDFPRSIQVQIGQPNNPSGTKTVYVFSKGGGHGGG